MDSAAIRENVVKILVSDFRVPESKIKDEGTFRGTFGMDSLDAVDFIYLVKKTFSIEAQLADFSQVHTLAALVKFLEAKLAEKEPSANQAP